MSIYVVADQRCSILRLEDPSNLTIANMFLDELQCFGVYVYLAVAGLALRGHFLGQVSALSNMNHRLLEV